MVSSCQQIAQQNVKPYLTAGHGGDITCHMPLHLCMRALVYALHMHVHVNKAVGAAPFNFSMT